MDRRENWFLCGVCDDKTRFCYLKTQLCRACGAFYRRAVTENIKYECQFEEKCKLDSRRRNICPACRFVKCRQLGPRLKKHPILVDQCNQHEEDDNSVALIDSNRLFVSEPLIDLLVQGYDWFLLKQRDLHMLKHPGVDFSNGKNLLIKDRSLTQKMLFELLPPMYSMFNHFYRAFSGLPSTQKTKLAAQAAYEISFMDKAYLTSLYFKRPNDKRMAMTNGYYVEHLRVDIKGYIHGLFMNKELEDFLSLYKPLSTRRFDNFQKFKQLGLQKYDVVCMMFLTMCRYIEYSGFLNDEFKRLREQLLNEWHSKFKSTHKDGDNPKKFAQIFEYYLETSNLTNDFTKTMTILALNNNRQDIQQLHDVNECLKKLNESPLENC